MESLIFDRTAVRTGVLGATRQNGVLISWLLNADLSI
jgi:hypothetical protein